VKYFLSQNLAQLVLLCCVCTAFASAAEPQLQTSFASERRVLSRDAVRIDGRSVKYTATAGTLLLRDEHGNPTANMFYISYVALGLGPARQRPITFAYNGGPGVSSTSLNIGAFGPKIVSGLDIDHRVVPDHLVNNPSSLLAKTDLVFIDAVGTGYSGAAGSATRKDFFGVNQDGKAFAQFIRRYVFSNGRTTSPKYLLGVSYGTTRSAVVANLLKQAGINLSGIVLMSTVLDFPAVSGGAGQDLQFSLRLPTEAMIASYYDKVEVPAANLDRFLANVRAFAVGPYAEALEQGDTVSDVVRRHVAQRLHGYTGLSVADILRANLRISPDLFTTKLLAKKTVGLYDGRVSVFNTSARGGVSNADPSTTAESAAFAAVAPSLLRQTLHYVRNETYVLTSLDVTRQWDWGDGGPSGSNVTDDLAEVMSTSPHLRVLSLNGYYDLRTPFLGTEYQLAHLGVSPAVHRQITIKYYRAGHMIFIDPKARSEMKRDLDDFYDSEPAAALDSRGHLRSAAE